MIFAPEVIERAARELYETEKLIDGHRCSKCGTWVPPPGGPAGWAGLSDYWLEVYRAKARHTLEAAVGSDWVNDPDGPHARVRLEKKP